MTPTWGRGMRAALAAGAVAALAVLLLLTPELGSLGGDNADYVLLAKSLRAGDGYRSPWPPGETPLHTLYPPVWPLLLVPFVGDAPSSFLGAHLPLLGAAFAAAFLLARLFQRRGLPPRVAAACAAAPLLSVFALRCAVDLLSELPFLALAAGALLALQPAEGEEDAPLPPRRLAAAAACTALAFLTRTAGLALAIPVVLSLLLHRRTRGIRGLVGAAAVAAAVGGWFLYRGLAGGGGGYGEQLGAGGAGLAGLVERAWTQLNGMYLPGTPRYLFPHGGGGWAAAGTVLWGLALAAVAAGILRRRAGAVPEAFLLVYLGMQSAWPFTDPRFALPLAALLPGLAAETVRDLATRFARRARTTALALLAALLLIPNLLLLVTQVVPRAHRTAPAAAPGEHRPAAFVDSWRWTDRQFASAAPHFASWLHACDVIRVGEPGLLPEGPVMAANPRIAALLTGRRAVQPLPGASAAETASRARETGVALVLVDGFGNDYSAALRAWRDAGSGKLEPVLRLPGGMEVLRVLP